MISSAEIVEVIPVIVSLIVIEGLLSVDNALAIAALASHLPKNRQQMALKLGIVGAYAFRGLALFFVSVIIANPWLKIIGAAYLIYLMASNLAEKAGEETEEDRHTKRSPGLLLTILRIELMDLSLSVDNVVAAVALDKRLWVICIGVFIGILALRFLAGYCIKLIEKFPILESTAFLLIGFVGVILLVEIGFELSHRHLEIQSSQKFIGIVAIIALSLFYDRSKIGRALIRPLVTIGVPIMVALDKFIGVLFWPAATCIHLGKKLVFRRPATAVS